MTRRASNRRDPIASLESEVRATDRSTRSHRERRSIFAFLLRPFQGDVSKGSRLIVTCALALVVASLCILAIDQLYRPGAFPVTAVHYSGYFKHVKPQELERVVNPVVKGNLFALDLELVKQRAESLPWVERANVRRRWPGVVSVDITEQTLLARWLPGGFINQHGEVVDLPESVVPGNIPILSGPVAGRYAGQTSSSHLLDRYRRWGNLLAAAGLQVQELTLDDTEVWHARVRLSRDADRIAMKLHGVTTNTQDFTADVQHSMQVVIGRHEADYRLARFARMFSQALRPKFTNIDRIDLRYPNGFAVQWHYDPSTTNESQQKRTTQMSTGGATRA